MKIINEAAETLFEKFALKHQRDVKNLEATRCIDSIVGSSGSITCSSLADVLRNEFGTQLNWSNDYGYWRRTGVLMYAHEGLQLHSWLVGEEGLLSYCSKMISREELERCIQEHRLAIGIEQLQARRAPTYRKLVALDGLGAGKSLDVANIELTELLIPPTIAFALGEIDHLIIVPVYSLGVVPFAMLKPFVNKEVVLIDQVSLSIAPSIFDLDQRLKETFERPGLNFTFESPLIAGLAEFPQHVKHQFSELPGVKKEVEAIAKELGVQPLLNSQVTKKEICKNAEVADLIYIATHGFADENEGYLVLWGDKYSDSIWSGQEIHDLKFGNAYVAVLSACQTGLGRVHDAGMVGVARSFQMGGVPRIVVSLWSVKDEETAIFMVRLVQNMRETMVAEALRKTVLEMRRDYPDPAVWASFSLFGTPR